jgi:uncharacterized membrane protein YfcA
MSSLLTIVLLVGIVVFVTHALEAVTGFGCTVLAYPFVMAITGDIGFSKIILCLLGWLLALYIAIVRFKDINWRQFGIISSLAVLGLPVGIYLFKSFDQNLLTRLLGCFIFISACIQLYIIYRNRIANSSGYLRYLYLFLGGIVHGAFAIGGPFIVLYSAKALKNKAEFRATMCLLWSCLNTLLIIQFFIDGQLTQKIGVNLLAQLSFLIAGVIVGEIIHKKVDEELFKKIVFWLLAIIGLIMLII